jgi:hypothetical protein
MAVAVFVTISLILMSRVSSLPDSTPFVTDIQSPHVVTIKPSEVDPLAKQPSSLGVDLLDAELDTAPQSPVTPALTQGHVIMPHLNNETDK